MNNQLSLDALIKNINSGEAVVLFFTAPWCKPCSKLKEVLVPEIEKSDLKCYEINVMEDMEISNYFGVKSLPTVILFNNNSVVDGLYGFIPSKLDSFVNLVKGFVS